MEVDTQRLHAYWHIAHTDESAAWFLRLYSAAGELLREQAVKVPHDQCYLDDLDSGACYQAGLGFYADGQWLEAARSNTAQLPTRLPQLAYAFPAFWHDQGAAAETASAPLAVALLPEFPNCDGLGSQLPALNLSETAYARERVCAMESIERVRQSQHLPTLGGRQSRTAWLTPSDTPAPVFLPSAQAFALETFLGLSSQPLDLDLHAELKIAGKAPLQTEVYLFGKVLAQDAQGRFSLTIPLAIQRALDLFKTSGDD